MYDASSVMGSRRMVVATLLHTEKDYIPSMEHNIKRDIKSRNVEQTMEEIITLSEVSKVIPSLSETLEIDGKISAGKSGKNSAFNVAPSHRLFEVQR